MTGKLREFTGAKDQKRAARDASAAQQEAQRNVIDYLEKTEALPRAFREAALTDLGAGLGYTLDEEGNVITEGFDAIEQARRSPLYDAILGSRQQGEEAIARTASATGGLRSGATIGALTDYNQQLQNQALQAGYQDVLNRQNILLGLPTNEQAIAQSMGNIGSIQAQGIQAAGGAARQGFQDLLGLGGLGLQGLTAGASVAKAGGLGALFSDVRLKDNIEEIGNTSHHGIKKYKWDWKDGSGASAGYLAQEVEQYFPDLVIDDEETGYKKIYQGKLEARLNGGN